MHILIVTDAWRPQVNGVVHTLERLAVEAEKKGVKITFLTPEGFYTIALPFYPEIRLALTTPKRVARLIDDIAPDALHIATEGPLGLYARHYAMRTKRPFTSCFHTRYPQYVSARLPIAEKIIYSLLRWFHNGAATTMVATPQLHAELSEQGFEHLALWSRGVDAQLFRPRSNVNLNLPRPIFLSVGRIAIEKNLDAFLSLDLPGSQLIIGDGPDRTRLQSLYPKAHFWGMRRDEDLATIYAGADVFVFPSKTDTFGLVLLEALASGLPIAAFPVPGPLNAMQDANCAITDDDLRKAALQALALSPQQCRAHALTYSHSHSAQQFIDNVTNALHGVNGIIKPPSSVHYFKSLAFPALPQHMEK
jgi:glycosyltransferase involved in cell wall biosynthesis